eukprot:s2939_g3.t1
MAFDKAVTSVDASLPLSKVNRLIEVLGAANLLQDIDLDRLYTLNVPVTEKVALIVPLSHILRFAPKPPFRNAANYSVAMIRTKITGAKLSLAEGLVRPADWTYKVNGLTFPRTIRSSAFTQRLDIEGCDPPHLPVAALLYQQAGNFWLRKLAHGRELSLIPSGDIAIAAVVFATELLSQLRNRGIDLDRVSHCRARQDGQTLDKTNSTDEGHRSNLSAHDHPAPTTSGRTQATSG